ncbi:MAG: cryptochrome/photolyase family protein [Chloroflexi bacterium AL-W]|nr:cryptochrome/photolyase family protein [Chloroflexi bacterium AL-N1]NOK68298.1 cryptochrome/photolyase family protein [Chloroflexi bacterium AL-N10]NOK73944.1 cryptochrome/photolyase family protein [Chloroflexi bacterium AL-N5]NOK82912.1 cryptochrome/photolyase family protein [Chloroflexi bacterium AL-W]NOK90434.1 cryptochrome/photolyase family protein [Chloroflexi bacterium AL-N15]
MKDQCVSVWILGDQLLRNHPALVQATKTVGIKHIQVVLIESDGRIAQQPYHRKKLVLLLSAMRHYAAALHEQGYQVDYVHAADFLVGLRQHIETHQPTRIMTMAASEYHTRRFQEAGLADGLGLPVDVLPNTQFLVGRFDPHPEPKPGKRYVMENFYRAMRRYFDVLMDGDKPAGGEWNYDKHNREPLPKHIEQPTIPAYSSDAITQEVIQQVASYEHATGTLENFNLAVTHEQAQQALTDFIEQRLHDFGPYEDAMSTRHPTLFHSVLSPYINIGLLEPLEMVQAAVEAYEQDQAPINSVEGFVRQVLGWREYIYWQYWQQMPDLYKANDWNATRPLPQMFWDGQTEMNCIKHVVSRAIETGYNHHIERLMIICNFCMLAGINPQQVNDWFLAFYIDAYDWVMQPNVIGMGLNADGGRIATKPYISSANYINKMSNYCGGCRFKHKQRVGEEACPFNFLYWHFLITHEKKLRANPRFGPSILGVGRIDSTEREAIQRQSEHFLAKLEYYKTTSE